MADLLVRNLDDAMKEALASQAAKNGRSQQVEARMILEDALRFDSCSWVTRLRRAARLADGIELDLPARHPSRAVEAEGWL